MSGQAMRMFDATCEVLRRARVPDPRVAQPATQWSSGVPADDLDESCSYAAASCIGRAIRTGDAKTAAELFGKLAHLCKREFQPRHYGAILNEVTVRLCIADSTDRRVWDLCWPVLIEMHRALPDDPSLQTALGELVRGLTGICLVVEERDIWKANYQRLAGAFPVRQMLCFRKMLLGIRDPEATP
jgi:hypothetical protein